MSLNTFYDFFMHTNQMRTICFCFVNTLYPDITIHFYLSNNFIDVFKVKINSGLSKMNV